jgi:hypothetical protein
MTKVAVKMMIPMMIFFIFPSAPVKMVMNYFWYKLPGVSALQPVTRQKGKKVVTGNKKTEPL